MQWQDVLYYVFWGGMFFVMMRFGCGAHIMGHGHHKGSSAPDHGSGSGTPVRTSVPETLPDRVTDPVCGMSVKTAAAKTSAHLGRLYYVCSQNGREKFEASPETYARAGVALLEREPHHVGC